MADFNFAQCFGEWEAKRRLTHVESTSESLRRSLLNTPSHCGQECGAGSSNYDQGHDPMMASASGSVDQGHGSTEAASGTRPKTRSQTPAAKAVVEVDSIHLLAVTLAEAMNANQP